VVKLILLFGFTVCAYSGPLLITSGSWSLSDFGGHWTFIGDGFSASGFNDFAGLNHCGFCFAPFPLSNPVPVAVPAANGQLTLGEKSYILPDAGFNGGSPFAVGSVFLSPQGTLPTVPGAGTYDVPFNVGGSFCVTDDPHVPPPHAPDPACFSILGSAIAHYTVSSTGTPNAFFQPVPTIEIVPVPEPATLGAGLLVLLSMVAAKSGTKIASLTVIKRL
jgi:hypothetical protein